VPTAKTPPLPSLWQAVDEAAAVDELRELLVKTQSIQERARERLDALQQREERLAQSSRKGFLRSLEEQIGLPPQVSWRVELIERASVLVEWSNPLSDEWTVENAQSLLTDNAAASIAHWQKESSPTCLDTGLDLPSLAAQDLPSSPTCLDIGLDLP